MYCRLSSSGLHLRDPAILKKGNGAFLVVWSIPAGSRDNNCSHKLITPWGLSVLIPCKVSRRIPVAEAALLHVHVGLFCMPSSAGLFWDAMENMTWSTCSFTPHTHHNCQKSINGTWIDDNKESSLIIWGLNRMFPVWPTVKASSGPHM